MAFTKAATCHGLSRLVRDHGAAMELALNDRPRAWKEHGADATLAILRFRVAMAELQDRFEPLILPMLARDMRTKVEEARPMQLLVAGRL